MDRPALPCHSCVPEGEFGRQFRGRFCAAKAKRRPFRSGVIMIEIAPSAKVSALADIEESIRGTRIVLAYVYRAESEAIRRGGNEPHRGSAELLIETEPTLAFEGDYWTDRKTVGRLRSIGWNRSCIH